jgi:microsomal dipeptidase-like Zn-dependent dipeptidase
VRRALALAALASAVFAATAQAGPAAGCYSMRGERLYVKPTTLTTFMLYDRDGKLLTPSGKRVDAPSADAEWTSRRAGKLVRARGCKPYPEASLGATGKTFKGTLRDGTVLGFADPHIHVTAQLRAGGLVISGQTFNRFGVIEALGHDEDVHGTNGSGDITGNLLRSGNPVGTHDTHGWPSFSGWPTYDTYTHQQIYWRWLERAWMSGMRLAGAMIVEDEPLCAIEPRKTHSCDETQTILLEIKLLHELQDYIDAQYGGRGRGFFRLVFDPRSARRVIERGKLAVLIGVESSNPFGCRLANGQPQCTRADIDRGIGLLEKAGVRTIFPAHWVDNALAGAALEAGDKGTFISAMQLSYTGGPFQTGACPQPEQGEPGPLGARECNARGLTDLGEYAIEKLMDAHMLIEADHLSEWAREKVLTLAETRHYPLVSSHTGTGGLWTPNELRRLFALGGYATARIDDAAELPGAILAYRRYQSPNRYLGVGLGSDTGGFNELPGPAPVTYPFRPYRGHVVFSRQQTGTRAFDLTRDGVAHYGLLPDLLAAVQLQPNGRAALGVLFHSAEAYLEMWQRAEGTR